MKRSISVSYLFLGVCTFLILSSDSFSFPPYYHAHQKRLKDQGAKRILTPVQCDLLKLGVAKSPYLRANDNASTARNMFFQHQQWLAKTKSNNGLEMSTDNISKISDIPNISVAKDKKNKFATMMAFLTGIADVTLNLKYKTFATMMTGNTMWMALAATESRYIDIGYYASVIASYLVGLAVFRKTDLSLREKSMKVCALLVSGLFVGSDVIFHCTNTKWLPVMMLAAGFAIVNSVGMEVAGTLTFVITGHMTKLTNQAFDRVSRTAGRKKLTPSERKAVKLNASVIAGFFMGALFACFLKGKNLIRKTGLFSVMGILYGTLFLWQDMEAMGGAWWLRKGDKFCDLDDDGKLCENNEKD